MTGSNPPISWFRDPGFTEPTPLTVTPDGRVYGHLCEFDRAHIGFGGRQVFAPRGDDMRFFLTGATDVVGDDGNVMEISVGKLTMDTDHASIAQHVTTEAAARHYSDTGTIAALVNAGSDSIGIWMAGSLLPGLDELTIRRFRACGASGDWRPVNGQLRLVAALSVPVGGFPIPRARVASGAPMALVAAGMVQPERGQVAFARRVDPAWKQPTKLVGKLTIGDLAVSNARIESITVTPNRPAALSAADFADQVAAHLDERRRAGELTAQQEQLLADLDESPIRAAALLAELDDTPARFAAAVAAFGAGDVDPKGVTA